MTRTHKLLDFYASKAWAIQESALHEMYGIYQAALQRKLNGEDFDPEAVAAKSGTRLDNTRSVEVRDGVAIIPVSGPIFRYANLFTQISGATSIEMLAKDFDQALESPRVKSILLDINSPGGEVDGTSEFAQHVFDARGKKPIVAYVSHVGASAAYWIASATEEIVAQETASLGSIGVVGTVCVHKDKGHIEFVSSQSPNKRPNPESEEGRSQIQEHIDSLAEVFINTVARNMGWTADEVIQRGGRGGLKVGQRAVDAGLADRLGTLEGVIAELAMTDIASWKPKRKNLNSKSVLETRDKSDEGDLDMAEEKPAAADNKPALDNAALDKSIGERVSAFFQEKFGAKADAEPLAKADERVDAHAAELERLKAETEKANKEAADAKAQVALLQKQGREARFSGLAKDWPGESAKHVAMLELLATSQEGGEESAAFKDHVTNMNAVAAQAKTSKLFEEIGSSQPVEGAISAQVEADIKKRMDADPKLTYAVAFDQVRQGLTPAQRSEYDGEQRRSVN